MRQHQQLNGHESEQTPGDSEGQGSLAYCSPQGHKELDPTQQLNNNKKIIPLQTPFQGVPAFPASVREGSWVIRGPLPGPQRTSFLRIKCCPQECSLVRKLQQIHFPGRQYKLVVKLLNMKTSSITQQLCHLTLSLSFSYLFYEMG